MAEMTVYTHNPDVAHLFELEQQVRRLQREVENLSRALRTERERSGELRVQNRYYAEAATEEINRSTRAYVDQIKNQQTYITFLERHQP